MNNLVLENERGIESKHRVKKQTNGHSPKEKRNERELKSEKVGDVPFKLQRRNDMGK